MRIVRISKNNSKIFQSEIAELERFASYPLGNDSFKIDHGSNYFSFFERLGKLRYYFLEHMGQIVAVGAGVLRKISRTPEGDFCQAWYLCDLKVHPDFRGQHLPLKLLSSVFLPNYIRCSRAYGISMNPSNGAPNRVMKLLKRFRWLPFKLAGNLNIYSLHYEPILRCQTMLGRTFGPISFLSLSGQKDLILQSTGQPMPLLHVQHGICGKVGRPLPEPEFIHMFCILDNDPLIGDLAAIDIHPVARASIISHRMENFDWKFVLTSDI